MTSGTKCRSRFWIPCFRVAVEDGQGFSVELALPDTLDLSPLEVVVTARDRAGRRGPS